MLLSEPELRQQRDELLVVLLPTYALTVEKACTSCLPIWVALSYPGKDLANYRRLIVWFLRHVGAQICCTYRCQITLPMLRP